eukprot:292647-Amorphochlora_amoeboformis.AAC.1
MFENIFEERWISLEIPKIVGDPGDYWRSRRLLESRRLIEIRRLLEIPEIAGDHLIPYYPVLPGIPVLRR